MVSQAQVSSRVSRQRPRFGEGRLQVTHEPRKQHAFWIWRTEVHSEKGKMLLGGS